MTVQEQLSRWVTGESIHNPTRNECCPDFSCCNPGMLWSEERRKAFARAEEHGEERHRMLMDALGELLDYHEKRRVRVVG